MAKETSHSASNQPQKGPISAGGQRELASAGGNQMALAMMLLLEQQHRQQQIAQQQQAQHQQQRLYMQQQQQQMYGKQQQRNPPPPPFVATMDEQQQQQALQLLTCNVPLPKSISAEAIHPVLTSSCLFTEQSTYGQYYPGGLSGSGSVPSRALPYGAERMMSGREREQEGPVVVRGLPVGVMRAIKAIKALVLPRN
jgi:hypothetical protein